MRVRYGNASPRARTWMAVALVWTIVCLFNAEQTYITLAVSGRPLPWLRVLALHAPGMVLWALATPAIMALTGRVSLDHRGIAAHVAVALCMAVLDAGLYRLIDQWVSISGPRTLLENFVRYLQINVMNYIAVVATDRRTANGIGELLQRATVQKAASSAFRRSPFSVPRSRNSSGPLVLIHREGYIYKLFPNMHLSPGRAHK